MPRGHPRALTAITAGGLCALLAAGPALAHAPRAHLLPRSIPAQAPGDAPSSEGQGVPLAVVVVPEAPEAEEAAARINYVARQAVQRSGRFDVIRPSDALDPQATQDRQAQAAEAQAHLASAREAYNNLDTLKALQDADKAISAWAKTDLTLHLGELTEAWIFKIASHVANGENKEAQADTARLLAVNPDAQFSTNYFPPEDIAAAQKVREEVRAANESLQVSTTPAGAEIYVNGRFQGLSPVTVQGLAKGRHFVTALKPGFALTQERSEPGQVSLTLAPAAQKARFDDLVREVTRDPEGPGRDEAAKKLGELLGAEQVLLLHVAEPKGREAKVTAVRLEVSDGHNFAYAQKDLPTDATALLQQGDAFVNGLLAEDAERRGGKPLTNFVVREPLNVKKTAGYGLLGAGAVAMVVGTVFGVRAVGLRSDALAQAEARDSRAFRTADRGKSAALVADLSWLVGLAAAGGGAYLTFFSGDDKPKGAAGADGKGQEDAAAAERRKRDEDAARKKREEEQRRRQRDGDDLREDDDLRGF